MNLEFINYKTGREFKLSPFLFLNFKYHKLTKNLKAYYFWEGSEEPRYLQSCKKSWKEHGLDVEKINLDYRDFLHVDYIKRKAKRANWAFVSDYLRYVWFQDHEGIYMDTDMFLFKEIPQEFLDADFSIGMVTSHQAGQGIMKIKKGHPFLTKLCHFYENFNDVKDAYAKTCSGNAFRYVANINQDFTIGNEEIREVGGITYFGRSYCYPIPFIIMENASHYPSYFTDKSFAIHQWHGSAAKKGGAIQKRTELWFENKECQKLLQDVLKNSKCEYFTREE